MLRTRSAGRAGRATSDDKDLELGPDAELGGAELELGGLIPEGFDEEDAGPDEAAGPEGNEYDIVVEEGVASPVSEDEIRADLDRVLAEEGVGRPCMVSVSVVSDERIRELNAEYRSKDAVTDVLECERPDDPDLAPGEPCELGDIVIAPAFVASRAAGFGTTAADEFRLLLVHGCLHLLGYDHLADDEAEVMEAREDELVALLPHDGVRGHVELTRHREGVDE